MKQLEIITAERDASVVRYAVSERSILEATKSKEVALSAEQTARREVSMIGQRLKIANADKTRATAALDMKVLLFTFKMSRCIQFCYVWIDFSVDSAMNYQYHNEKHRE